MLQMFADDLFAGLPVIRFGKRLVITVEAAA